MRGENISLVPSPQKEEKTSGSEESCWYVNFDGLCEPRNPGGVATYGLLIRKGREVVLRDSGLGFARPWSDEASNNVAEYSAVIKALEWLKEKGHESECVYLKGDSRLVINQLSGKFKIKAPRLVELHQRAVELLSDFKDAHLEWVDRSQNAEADLLSRVAYSRFLKSETRSKESRRSAV